MIARPLPYEDRDEPIGHRPARSRVARAAAMRRRARTKRMRYAAFVRIIATVAVLTSAVVLYLGLMANVTRMNYELGRVERERVALIDQTAHLDDTIARLRSRDRLGRIAAALRMHESRTFVSIALPVDRPLPPPSGLAFLTRPR